MPINGNPLLGLTQQRSTSYPKIPTKTVGGSNRDGSMGPHVGGETWEMNSNRDGQQFTAAPLSKVGMGYGGSQARIGGPGEAPLATTAADYERAHGGSLSRDYGSMGSLQDFYASRSTNPYTGLPYNPSANDLQRQQQYFQQKGDFEGLGALGAYNQARSSGNPYLLGQAQQGITSLQGRRAATQGYQDAMNAINGARQGVASGINRVNPYLPSGVSGAATAKTQGTSQSIFGQQPQDEMMDPNAMYGARAKGGPVGKVNPYLVGEKGPEEYVPMHGKPEMVGLGGPEVRTFPDKGKIVPNNKLPHRAVGGPVQASPGGLEGVWNDMGFGEETGPPREFAAVGKRNSMAPADLLRGDLYGPPPMPMPYQRLSYRLPSLGIGVRQANPYLSYGIVNTPTVTEAAPAYDGEADEPVDLADNAPETAPAASEPVSIPRSRIANPLSPQATQILKNAMAAEGATETSPGTYVTRRGTVSNAPTTAHTIQGLPAAEWFQRQANKWGANPYAGPEKGFPTEGTEVKALNVGKERERKEANKKGLPEGLRWAVGK